jgi:hypothetical protein
LVASATTPGTSPESVAFFSRESSLSFSCMAASFESQITQYAKSRCTHLVTCASADRKYVGLAQRASQETEEDFGRLSPCRRHGLSGQPIVSDANAQLRAGDKTGA